MPFNVSTEAGMILIIAMQWNMLVTFWWDKPSYLYRTKGWCNLTGNLSWLVLFKYWIASQVKQSPENPTISKLHGMCIEFSQIFSASSILHITQLLRLVAMTKTICCVIIGMTFSLSYNFIFICLLIIFTIWSTEK